MGLFDKKEKPGIARVKCLGVCTGPNISAWAGAYDDTYYCFLVEQTDGSRYVCSYTDEDPELKELLPYIPMD